MATSPSRRTGATPASPLSSRSVAATPSRVAQIRSTADGVPPRWRWPSTVTRVSNPVSCSIRRLSPSPTPRRESWTWPNASVVPSSPLRSRPTRQAPSATTMMLKSLPSPRRRWRCLTTSSISTGNSGMMTRSAPPASPPANATHPVSRPMTSTTMTRWCADAVVCRRSRPSTTIPTAVSKPMQKSVADRSLSMVLGTPTTRNPPSCSARATDRVSSPPMATSPSTPNRLRVARTRAMPSASFIGLVRDVPRMVPPSGRMPRTSAGTRSSRSPCSAPAQPFLIPLTWWPSWKARLATPRMAAFRPGASPPPVRTPIRIFSSLQVKGHAGPTAGGWPHSKTPGGGKTVARIRGLPPPPQPRPCVQRAPLPTPRRPEESHVGPHERFPGPGKRTLVRMNDSRASAQDALVADATRDALRVQVFQQGQHRPAARAHPVSHARDRDRALAGHRVPHERQRLLVGRPCERHVVRQPDQLALLRQRAHHLGRRAGLPHRLGQRGRREGLLPQDLQEPPCRAAGRRVDLHAVVGQRHLTAALGQHAVPRQLRQRRTERGRGQAQAALQLL